MLSLLDQMVAPYTGAWIEIVNTWEEIADMLHVAPYTGAWIEIRFSR